MEGYKREGIDPTPYYWFSDQVLLASYTFSFWSGWSILILSVPRRKGKRTKRTNVCPMVLFPKDPKSFEDECCPFSRLRNVPRCGCHGFLDSRPPTPFLPPFNFQTRDMRCMCCYEWLHLLNFFLSDLFRTTWALLFKKDRTSLKLVFFCLYVSQAEISSAFLSLSTFKEIAPTQDYPAVNWEGLNFEDCQGDCFHKYE